MIRKTQIVWYLNFLSFQNFSNAALTTFDITSVFSILKNDYLFLTEFSSTLDCGKLLSHYRFDLKRTND